VRGKETPTSDIAKPIDQWKMPERIQAAI